MAITPSNVLDVTEAESNRMDRVEAAIDKMLTKHYRVGDVVLYPVGKRWRPGFTNALMLRYQQVGWDVQIVEREELEYLQFDHVAPKPAVSAARLEVRSSNSGELVTEG